MREDLLEALSEAHAPSGHEQAVRDIVRPELERLCDRVVEDPLGGLAGVREGDGPRLMLAAHMDEIGLMVRSVDERGFLRVIPLGGWDARTLVSQRVLVHGREAVPGVVSSPPVHLLDGSQRGGALKIEDLAIDIGLDADRARELVRAGDVVTRDQPFRRVGDLLTGKAIDDRVGVLVLVEALELATRGACELWGVATVQEEVGLRGARVAASRVRPDIALAIDTCPAADGPGKAGGRATAKLGEGAAIRVMDASAIVPQQVVDALVAIAEEREIPFQMHLSDRGGTDTGELQRSGDGALAGCVSIPARYGHSSVEACHPDDVDAAIALVAGFVERAAELLPVEVAAPVR